MSRSELVARAKLSELAQRYDDMVIEMKAVVQLSEDLSNEERNLLSVAYKQTTAARRTSWRVMTTIEQKAVSESDKRREMVRSYREKIENELETLCMDLIQLIDSKLLKAAALNINTTVFYVKMKADYYRYLSEVVSVPEKRKKIIKAAYVAYSEALETAARSMQPISPILLGLSLNYSVFLYEIKNSEKKAIKLAKEAYDLALQNIEGLKQAHNRDSLMIMQLIRANMASWNGQVASTSAKR